MATENSYKNNYEQWFSSQKIIFARIFTIIFVLITIFYIYKYFENLYSETLLNIVWIET